MTSIPRDTRLRGTARALWAALGERARAVVTAPPVGHFFVPLAACFAIQGFAFGQADLVGRGESLYLALVVGAVLAAIAAIAPRPAWELGATAVLVTTVIWMIGFGPQRGALVTLLLTAGLAAAVGHRVARDGASLAPSFSIPLAIGLQLLMRCGLLLDPLFSARGLVSLLLLPLAAGLALSILAQRFDPRLAWMAGAVAVVLAPGFNVTVTLALLALAGGALLASRDQPAGVRMLAILLLLLPLAWRPPTGLLFAAAGLALAAQGRWAFLPPVVAAAVAVFAPASRPWPAALELWGVGLFLVPALLLAPRAAWARIASGVLLALAAARSGQEGDALTGALALVALGLPLGGAGAALQRTWSAALVAGTAFFAVYPWVRQAPLHDALALLGLESTGPAVAGLLVLTAGLALALDRLPRRAGFVVRGELVAALALAVALFLVIPEPAFVAVGFPPVLVTQEGGSWSRAVPAQPVSEVVVDTNLFQGLGLAPGTPVAELQLYDGEKRVVARWELAAGEDTAEWLVDRPDMAAHPGLVAPPPWLSQVGEDRSFFARRFRTRWHLAAPVAVSQVAILRSTALPPETQLAVYRLELRR